MNEFGDDVTVETVSLDDEESSGRSRMPVIIAGALIVLAAGAFIVWKFVLNKSADDTELSGADSLAVIDEDGEREPPPFGEVYIIDDIIINPVGQRRLFMVTIGLEVFKPELLDEIKKREPLLRDNLITLFSSQPINVLADIRYRQAFRARVMKIMDYQLGEGKITRIFFQKWVFQ